MVLVEVEAYMFRLVKEMGLYVYTLSAIVDLDMFVQVFLDACRCLAKY
jgi:hypothetical protein